MTTLSDRVLSIFLDKRVLLLTDSEISLALVDQGIPCSADEIQRYVQSLSPAVFQLSIQKDHSTTIRLDPIIDICQAFLAGRCHNQVHSCDKLHICREFGRCTIRNCRYPHDFTRGTNRMIVERNHCEDINPQVLVSIIRLKKSLDKASAHSDGNFTHRHSSISHQPLPKIDDTQKQIDVSFPSVRLAQKMDMEMIEMILTSARDIPIEKKFSECANEYFRRCTIQLEHLQDMQKLLAAPILTQNLVDIKFKRTDSMIDRSSFLLKLMKDQQSEKVTEGRIRLYTALLVGNSLFTIDDLSTANEQVFLIQCKDVLDFEKVRQKYQAKQRLQNRDIALVQIYECDTVIIRYLDENRQMDYDEIENMIRSVRRNVFTFQLISENCVEVEFLNNYAYREWMNNVQATVRKFQISVTPVIKTVDEAMSSSESVTDAVQNASSTIERTLPVTIKLRFNWSLVAAHHLFQVEYKDYIRAELGGEIEIKGDTVVITGGIPKSPHVTISEAILVNRTNNFMQKFKFNALRDLKTHHLVILRAHSASVAYTRTQRNDYLAAAKASDMIEIKSKLFPKTNEAHPVYQSYPTTHRQTNDQSPPTVLMKEESTERVPARPRTPDLPTTIFPMTTAEQVSMFSINQFEDRLEEHLQEMFHVKATVERSTITDKVKGEKSRIVIKLSGQTDDMANAQTDLMNLFFLLRTRKFDDQRDGNWTKIDDAPLIIQHHFTVQNLICVCQKVSATKVYVHYFDVTNPQFGIDEQKIDDVINTLFSLATITYQSQSTGSNFIKEWTELEDAIRQRDDYKKDLCLGKEVNVIYLFGLPKLVKEFRQAFEQLKNKHLPQPCKITLSEKQLNYLSRVAKNEMNKLATQYQVDGCDFSLTRLREQGNFLAPSDLHSRIKASLEALVQIEEMSFTIESNAFEDFLTRNPDQLHSLVKSKCYLEKNVRTRQIQIPVPTAQVTDPEHSASHTPPPSSPNATSLTIGKSKITIAIGDLAAQAVDLIVVCSTSEILRKSIITTAGAQVQAEYDAAEKNQTDPCVTSSGALPSKRILFIPWKTSSSDPSSLKPSLCKFVSIAIAYALRKDYRSLAFPSVGCGKLGFDPSIVAQHMIDETKSQLTNNTSQMDVSFVLLPSQQNVFDEFVKSLNSIKTSTVPKAVLIKASDKQSSIPYEEKIIQITLISSNKQDLLKYKEKIFEFYRSSIFKLKLTGKTDMNDWSQNTIDRYYTYCLSQNVLPTLDFRISTLKLIGLKDTVHEAEKYFFELTTETFKQARIQAVARGVIWSVEITSGTETWEQYSFKLNGLIEDAHLKKLAHIDFVNDKQEKCRVTFQVMEEDHATVKRRVRRKVVDSLLPDTWESSDQNCKRVLLSSSSKEYQDVLQRFNATMTNAYTNIVKIERIQNERWFKQYTAHRDEYKQRYKQLDERLLFHGCLGTAANQIVQECFNRSFAGLNGIAFGCGVYFHTNASYSHSYAKPTGSRDRTMFLARVLVGRTCRGNQAMKVPPPGYDTTTDGQDIFVIYHDAGAYAEHLITYQ